MLGLVAQLFFFGYVAEKPLEGGDNPSGQEIRLLATAPERQLLLWSHFPRLLLKVRS